MTKIVQLVNNCKDCPNRHYYSGGTYECMKVQPSRLNDDMSIPAWCPLADYQTTTHTVYRPCEQHKHLPVTLTAIAVAAVPVCPHCTSGVKACATCGGSGEVRGWETIHGKRRAVVNNCPDCTHGVPGTPNDQQEKRDA